MIASKGRGFLRGNWSTWTIIRAETRSLMYLLRAVSIPSPAHVPVFPSSLPCYGLQEIPDLNIVQIKHVGFPLLHNFSIYRITGV